jgi:hypothetical protein
VSSLVLDAGALIAVDRADRATVALLSAAHDAGFNLRTNANVVAQVWRDDQGRQVQLGRFLRCVDIRTVDEAMGRAAGLLLAASGTHDVVDATVALLASAGDQILTGDRSDLVALVEARRLTVGIVEC